MVANSPVLAYNGGLVQKTEANYVINQP